MLKLPRVLISGDHGSAGKTTLTIGLARIFRNSGQNVQVFKKGPDFIDPLWHSAASGNPCRNLDYFMMENSILPTFLKHASAEINIIEGSKGLFDGIDTDGSNSSSALARFLQAPVILVIDTKKITRGIAPLIQGYLGFEKDLHIAGVILNNIAGQRHEAKLLASVEKYCDIEVLGSVFRNAELMIDERHLGLVPSQELAESDKKIEKIAEIIQESVNLKRLSEIASLSPNLKKGVNPINIKNDKSQIGSLKKSFKIGIAKDNAFNFYYPENLEALANEGAELVYFSPMVDEKLPEVDGLVFGGGFPEIFASELSLNHKILSEIKVKIENGMPVYAECGGLMYLSRFIRTEEKEFSMAGILPFGVKMTKKPQGRGYMTIRTIPYTTKKDTDWVIPGNISVNAHEFHHSVPVLGSLNTQGITYIYKVERGFGVNGENDGIIYKNLLASYAHLHNNASTWWAKTFTGVVKKQQQKIIGQATSF